MKNFLLDVICFTAKWLLKLRYNIKIKGKELLTKENLNKKGGILFLPNHPALMDPLIMATLFWTSFRVRPVVVEYVYRQGIVNTVLKLANTLAIPNLESSFSDLKKEKTEAVVKELCDGLKKGENFIIYPSGRLKHSGKEIVGGASATFGILQDVPETNIVLIRTTGLWGSSFSRALTGKSPEFFKVLVQNMKAILKNFIFFAPRRKVEIEIFPNPPDIPLNQGKLEFNRYLENWYNRYPTPSGTLDTEPLTLVPYSFWETKPLAVSLPPKKKRAKISEKISPKTQEIVYKELLRLAKRTEPLTREMSLAQDLGLDSLDVAELISFLSLHFDVEQIHPDDIETVQDVLEFADGKITTSAKTPFPTFTATWPIEKERPPSILPEGETIPEAFLNVCEKFSNFAAVADELSGVLSYKKFKIATLVLAKEFKKLPGQNVGVLLPASIGAYMTILALLIAGKTPVMLNWTLGTLYLEHMLKLTESQTTISSWRFLERLSNVEFGKLSKQMVFLEDIKKQISLPQKIAALFLSLKSTKNILKTFGSKSSDDTAVILFTSGTETFPKGVPLTHKNILNNQCSALSMAELDPTHVFLGSLPPFHSFGFAVTGLLPILAGFRVAYFPDPTDSFGMASAIEHFKITLLCLAPSFLKGLFQTATAEQLKSMQLFVCGAEKTPQELFTKVASLGQNKKLIEGYGITECSPIISLNHPKDPPKGVGHALPGTEVCTLNPETHTLLKKGQEGELCVKGAGVFNGYLGEKRDPFIMLNGQKWYRTGDLGYEDPDGNIILSGRIKRFAKIGGEMLSLYSLEDIIYQALKETIAVCAREKEGEKVTLVLFTTKDVEKNEINALLKEAGMSALAKISEIKKLEKIPLTGTGKIDYRLLQSMV